ncbi:MAG TPA: aminoacyl-tRNA hydrolase [Candidatus Bathyarchaeia archaeon]|nr:aminoacyl-tRNA hydrolase [Candidatus Bathyarchaeia archaeon]
MRKAVIGLGNPGREYAETRHNVGFRVVERLSTRIGAPLVLAPGALCGRGQVAGVEVVLCEPQRFMNRSGEVVARLAASEGLAPADILVVHDELDLVLGRVQVKRGGGSAGHRGVESIIERLGVREFPRVRIGVGRPPEGLDPVDFVLVPFSEDEQKLVEQAIVRAAEAVETWLGAGLEAAMRLANVRVPEPGEGS